MCSKKTESHHHLVSFFRSAALDEKAHISYSIFLSCHTLSFSFATARALPFLASHFLSLSLSLFLFTSTRLSLLFIHHDAPHAILFIETLAPWSTVCNWQRQRTGPLHFHALVQPSLFPVFAVGCYGQDWNKKSRIPARRWRRSHPSPTFKRQTDSKRAIGFIARLGILFRAGSICRTHLHRF